ncbi:MAG: hypothetical protein H7A41_04895 [Chlamydiales bacterium]|nr:hypothetical protein [Chlamydiales bacterium]
MDFPVSSSRSGTPHPDLSHSVGEVLRERARVPENAPRIKIGDQHYHVVRIVGGRYEAPISNPRELEKVIGIGEVYFSAHKKYAAANGLSERKIEYINEKGVHYEGGVLVTNREVTVEADEAIDYLKATDNYAWQDEVIRFEAHLDTLTPTDNFPRRVPHYLHRIATRSGNHGPYTVQQVKGFLLEYTRDKLSAAHEIYSTTHSRPEMQERVREDEREWIERFPTATSAIQGSRDYFKAGYLRTSNLWQMMVRTLQPAEYRLLPDVEDVDPLLDRGSPHSVSSPIPIPRRPEHRRAHSVDLGQSHFARGLDSSFRAPPRHLTPPPRSTLFEHEHDPRVPHHPSAFRPIGAERRTEEHQLHAPVPLRQGFQPSTPRLVREEVRDPVVVRDRSPSLSPSLPPHSLGSSHSAFRPPAHREMESRSPTPPLSSDVPPHMRTGSGIPPLHLDQSSMLHPTHPTAVEVVDRVDTHPPVSHLPPLERGREVHSPSPSSLLEEEWVEIDLGSRPPSPRGVVVPFEASAARRVDSRSPIPRSAQMRSFSRPTREPYFFEQAVYRERAELYPGLRMAAFSADPHEWSGRSEIQEACRGALTKLEGNADVRDYTPQEYNAIRRMIEMKESAGGFGILMNGTRYNLVIEGLKYAARTGRF